MIIAHFNEILLVKEKIMKTILKIHKKHIAYIDLYIIKYIYINKLKKHLQREIYILEILSLRVKYFKLIMCCQVTFVIMVCSHHLYTLISGANDAQ